ncbi:hypothetical protein GCM10022252_32210 [Streptosporangium oxazolinicum]|uniref:Uncharacterized protein n=1 Tax=Streptosporangium oxazolinicum TaxID=909287 RepID=A0ABP8AVW0_9ACTN
MKPTRPARRHRENERQWTDGPEWSQVAEVDSFRDGRHGNHPEVMKLQSAPPSLQENPPGVTDRSRHTGRQGAPAPPSFLIPREREAFPNDVETPEFGLE